jgi:phosphatidylserine/phosphatidylglycerophosphate/cardiolipin synthase-like enzyme
VEGRATRLMTAFTEIHRQIVRPDGVRRLGQALWMMVGEPVRLGDLVWARGILGDRGDTLLWQALCERGALSEHDSRLQAWRLASFLSVLWDASLEAEASGRLVWTLPPQLAVAGVIRNGYVSAAARMIESAEHRVTIVAPYLEPRGMGSLHRQLVDTVVRGVSLQILTHGVEDLASLASSSLEYLRRDCVGLPGRVRVWTATPSANVLIHLKAVVADDRGGIVGSANITAKAFGANVEAGVMLGPQEAGEFTRVFDEIVTSDLVSLAYTNESAGHRDDGR